MKKMGAIMALIGAIGAIGAIGYIECYEASLRDCMIKLAIYGLAFMTGMIMREMA